MIRTLIAATLAAVGSLYFPADLEFDESVTIEVVSHAVASSEEVALESAWVDAEASMDERCLMRNRDDGSIRVAVEHVQWVRGGYRAEVSASGWCRY